MAANESRRRTEPHGVVDVKSTPTSSFSYRPLQEDVHCTRFISIEPAEKGRPMVCTLKHIAFGDRPKYEALSYMWGDEANKTSIMVDGAEFFVGQNLYDALYYLRDHYETEKGALFWIDALSINQEDVAERNSQLRMMWQIYFRAQTVVIWLGEKYTKFQLEMKAAEAEDLKCTESIKPVEAPKEPAASIEDQQPAESKQSHLIEVRMVQALMNDGYWDRVWIIQEVGRAKKKLVCFGDQCMSWNSFISLMELHHHQHGKGPLRLSQQLEDRQGGSHTLMQLLINHRDALCKEPKDKIYGLIGLADDAHGFVMDYTRSLFQVWTDTMEFMNRRGLFGRGVDFDLVSFGYLVKSLLIKNQSPLDQLQGPNLSAEDTALVEVPAGHNAYDERVFSLQCCVLGRIVVTGPSGDGVVADIDATAEWCRRVQETYQGNLGDAQKESESLLRSIMDTSCQDLNTMCFGHVSSVKWRDEEFFFYNRQHHGGVKTDKAPSAVGAQTQLYQLETLGDNTQWRMGIASNQAQLGDYVCWVQGTKKGLVVRARVALPEFSYHLPKSVSARIFGTALVAEDVSMKRGINHSNRLGHNSYNSVVRIDASTLYYILPDRTEYEAAQRLS